MALGQTAGCPRVNRAKKFMCSPRNTGEIYKLLPLVNRRVVPGLSRLTPRVLLRQVPGVLLNPPPGGPITVLFFAKVQNKQLSRSLRKGTPGGTP